MVESGIVYRYRRTQLGYLVIAATFAVIVLIGVIMALAAFNWIAFGVLVVVVLVLLEFSSLTVTITGGELEARFGPGPVRKTIRLSDIESSRAVRNHWYYGWGIRLTPHGTLYNVSGLDAVEIQLRSGKKIRIGTDAPRELDQAIREAINTR